VSDIFKKITSIEPRSLLRPLPEDNHDADPVPEFITRESDILAERAAPPTTPEAKPEIETPQQIERPVITDAPITSAAIAVPKAASLSQDYAPSTAWMKWAGIAAVLIWLGASFAYIYGFFDLGRKWTELTPIQIAGVVLAVLLPAVLLGLLFYALRQPLARMNSLESVIKDQTTGLTHATAGAAQTTDEITSRLTTQRIALEAVAGTFDSRMAMLSSTLDEQSSKLEASTQLAENKIQEARISIDGAAEKINAASDVVKGNTIEAASTLTQSHEEIENLAEMIRARSAELDEVYRKHALDLTTMIGELRDEQQDMSISLEERLVKMRDMSLSAKVSAESLTEASQAGKLTVQALAEATRLTDTAVKKRFAEMENMVKFSGEKAESIRGLYRGSLRR